MRKKLNFANVSLTGALLAFGLTGCGTFHYTALPAVGPDPTSQTEAHRRGRLEVYTAYANPAGSRPMLQPAHTDYTIFLNDSWFAERVHNYRHADQAQPKLVTLPPGTYDIWAHASDTNGGSFAVVMPVVIEAGRATQVYLDGEWRPRDLGTGDQLVRLPTGEPVGWSAVKN